TYHARSRQGRLVAIPPQTGDVKKNVSHFSAIRQDEAESLGHIEPFDGAGDLHRLRGLLIAVARPPGPIAIRKPSCGRGILLHPSCLPSRWTDSATSRIASACPGLARPAGGFSTMAENTATYM